MKRICLLLLLALSTISLSANVTEDMNEYVWMEGNGEFYINFNNDNCYLEYSFDKSTWTEAVPTSAQEFSSFTKVPANTKIYFKGVNGVNQSFWGNDWWGCMRTTTDNIYSKYYTDGSYMNPCFGADDDNGVRITVGGNVLSLVFGDEFVDNFTSTVFSTLSRIFTSNSLIEDASRLYMLPSDYGKNQGWLFRYGEQYGTFQWCKSLKHGPHIRFLSKDLFSDCESLEDFYYEGDGTESDVEWFSSKTSSIVEKITIHVRKGVSIKSKPSNAVLVEDIISEGKCATPTISYNNGQLSFSCETENVVFNSSITDADINTYKTAIIQLGATYNISVYATKYGYDDSDVATATLCWIDATPQTEGITNGVAQITARPVLVKADNGFITVEGADDGTNVCIYTTDGKQVGSAISHNNAATIATNMRPGSIAIVKVGEKSVKVVLK